MILHSRYALAILGHHFRASWTIAGYLFSLYWKAHKVSEAAFIRKRRSDISLAMLGGRAPSRTSTIRRALRLGKQAVTMGIVKEAAFLETKREKSRLEAINNGVFDIAMVSDADKTNAAALHQHEQKNDEKRLHKARYHRAVLGQREICCLWRQSTFIEPGVPLRPLGKAFRTQQLSLELERSQATVFIVQRLSEPGQRVLWEAALRGGRISDAEFVWSGGRQGSSIKYEAPNMVTRTIWPSPSFCAAHAVLVAIIEGAAAAPGSKWSLVRSFGEFRDAALRAVRANRRREPLFLATSRGKRQRPALGPFAMDASEFIEFVSKVDVAGSRTGLAGT